MVHTRASRSLIGALQSALRRAALARLRSPMSPRFALAAMAPRSTRKPTGRSRRRFALHPACMADTPADRLSALEPELVQPMFDALRGHRRGAPGGRRLRAGPHAVSIGGRDFAAVLSCMPERRSIAFDAALAELHGLLGRRLQVAINLPGFALDCGFTAPCSGSAAASLNDPDGRSTPTATPTSSTSWQRRRRMPAFSTQRTTAASGGLR